MNIRPRIIPKFQGGGVPQWYLDRYGNRTSLIGWDLNRRYNYSNKNLNTNDHRNAGNLDTVYSKNEAYTGTPGAISSDIQAFYNSDGNGLSAENFVKLYNENAAKIRSHWAQDQTYNARTAEEHNRLFRKMFQSRSNQSESPGSSYNIGYQDNLDDIEGSSTWLRRMDQYEKEFDINNPDSNRLHEITLKDGTKAIVYKKANGDIGLYKNDNDTIDGGNPLGDQEVIITPQKKNEMPVGQKVDKESLWSKLGAGLKNVAPDLLDSLRLAGNMINNQRVYEESMKAIQPNLQQSYHTYRQVTGDEATKQGYYRRAVQGEQRAARPFTSDADRQVAYMNEAKRIGDELRAQGDLADNQRIRETSAESSAHLDSNIERDTTVANSNLTEMLKADAAKHQLTAQKHAADWTNLEQYLMGRQYKLEKEKAKQEGIQDQIKTLQMQEDIANDPDIKSAYDALNVKAKELFPNGNVDWNDSRLSEAIKNLQSVRRKAMIKYYTLYAKSGTKITKKDNSDKFLYKTSRDIVEHFRKMSKMTDDSRTKTLPKPIKLPSHPKKFQYGGLAPFTIYRPLGVGGEQTYQQSTESGSSSSSKSAKDDAAKNKLDMIKELFKQVQGLPIDVSKVYQEISGVLNKAKAFGEELSTDDLASMYLNVMNRMSQLKYSQESFEKAKALATSNEALNEIAVGVHGEMVLQDMDTGKTKIGTLSDWIKSGKKLNPLTNDQILELRAKSPNMVFNDDILGIVNNGVGINKVSAQIKSLAATIGSSTEKIEGISQVESNKIKAGIQILAGTAGTPDGYYKVSTDQKSSAENVKAALNYIYSMLPNNYKTLLEIHSDGKGKELIANFLNSQVSDYIKQDISPLTGKASSNKDNDKESSEGLKLDAATALVTGKGYQTEIELNPGSSYSVKALGRFTEFQKQGGGNMGAGTTMQEATESTLKGTLDWNKATIGGSKIIPTAYNQVILNNGEVAGVDLPVDPNNPDAPNFEMLKQLEELDKQLKLNNIEDNEQNWQKVNDLCDKLGIPHKYDSSGKLNQLTWKRFAAFQVTTPDTALVNKNVILDMVGVANDQERELYNGFIQQKTKDKNFELSDTFLGIFGHRDELYKGTVFVPVKESIVAAAISGGQNIHMSQATDLELREQGYDPNKINSYKKSEYSL